MPTSPSLLLRTLTLVGAMIAATLACAAPDYSTPYSFTTLAGTSSIGSQDGTDAAARFFSPQGIAVDSSGNLFVVDRGNQTIRKITPAGVVTTFAGAPGEPGTQDGNGTAARFEDPRGIAIDANDNIYVADYGSHTIRKITPAGATTTFAGLAAISGNVDGTGALARFNRPLWLASDPAGNLYVTEAGNNAIRKITPAGVVSTYAATSLWFPDGPDAGNGVYGSIAADASGNVYVCSYFTTNPHTHEPSPGDYYDEFIAYDYQIAPDGTRRWLWQNSASRYYSGRTQGSRGSVLTLDPTGQLVTANNFQIARFSDGRLVPFAGDGSIGGSDGPAAVAKFGFPVALAYGRDGTLYIADAGNNTVRKLSPAGEVTTIAGLALEKATGTLDGTASAARFVSPAGAALDAAGNVYVAEPSTHCIRKITPAGVVTTLAGNPGQSGSDDGVGSAARFNRPIAVTLGPDGALYVSDYQNHTIRRLTLDGTTTTFAGLATASGWNDGPRLTARFMFPNGLQFDTAGNLYVVSAATVRKITPAGEVTTLAGLNSETGYVDDTGSAARFTAPGGLAVDSAGNVYVTESASSPATARIRKIFPTGAVRTLAGAEPGYADGAAATARFDSPTAIAIDANNNLFVADRANQVLRKITVAGSVSTVAGLLDAAGNVDGVGRAARLFYPQGIAVDATGALYVSSGTTVRKGVLASGPTITTQPLSQSVTAGASVTLSVVATGTPTPTYQWQVNGTAIAGATGASLTISSVRNADAGDYTVVVSNGAATVTSNKATLTVTSAPPPPSPGGGGSGGGGGAPSAWFFLALLACGLARHARRACSSRTA